MGRRGSSVETGSLDSVFGHTAVIRPLDAEGRSGGRVAGAIDHQNASGDHPGGAEGRPERDHLSDRLLQPPAAMGGDVLDHGILTDLQSVRTAIAPPGRDVAGPVHSRMSRFDQEIEVGGERGILGEMPEDHGPSGVGGEAWEGGRHRIRSGA